MPGVSWANMGNAPRDVRACSGVRPPVFGALATTDCRPAHQEQPAIRREQ